MALRVFSGNRIFIYNIDISSGFRNKIFYKPLENEIITYQDKLDLVHDVIETFLKPHYIASEHNASGALLDSFNGRATDFGAVITSLDYIEYLIYGRAPNQDQDPEAIKSWVSWFAPNVFEPWADSKGINVNPYAVAYNIAKRGTIIYREGGSDLLYVLETNEVKEYIIKRLSSIAYINIQLYLSPSIQRLSRS